MSKIGPEFGQGPEVDLERSGGQDIGTHRELVKGEKRLLGYMSIAAPDPDA
jgi:hypothetical protein